MSDKPVPGTIEECLEEVARHGYLLRRTSRSDQPIEYQLLDPSSDPPRVIETFANDVWSEIDGVQAAVRFLRYFLEGSAEDD